MAQDWVHSGMRLKLAEIKRLLDDTPLSTSVSITTWPGQGAVYARRVGHAGA